MDPAARLGVPPGADAATIRAAFALRLRAVHPDVAGPGRADPASDVADLLAARDQLLAQPPTSPPPHRARSCSTSAPTSSLRYAPGYTVADNPAATCPDRIPPPPRTISGAHNRQPASASGLGASTGPNPLPGWHFEVVDVDVDRGDV